MSIISNAYTMDCYSLQVRYKNVFKLKNSKTHIFFLHVIKDESNVRYPIKNNIDVKIF